MESIRSTIPLLKAGTNMCTIDLKDAYYHVPVHSSHQKYLRFAIQGNGQIFHFQFSCLPFGISSAPRIFTKLVAEIVAHLRVQNVVIVPYLDDFLLAADTEKELEQHLQMVLALLGKLGWLINYQKSSLLPGTKKIFLGILLDSVQQRSFLPQKKRKKIIGAAQKFQKKKFCTIREAMKMLGLLTSCISSVPWGQFHTRHQSWMLTTWDRKQTSLDSRALIPEGVKNSLIWWTKITNLGKGVPWNLNPQVVITTDASHLGWGAHVQKRYIQGRWPPHIQRRSSNFRELRAVWEALKASKPILTGTHVKVLSDNMTAVALLRHQGATKHPALQALALKIFIWAEKVVQSISAIHLRGSETQEADFLSRNKIDPGEWSLKQQVFNSLVDRWGKPEVDLFATGKNTKVETFFSLNPLVGPRRVDALSQPWNMELGYAFPPIPLIPAVLKKIQREPTRLILVVPFWPKRSWFPMLGRLALEDPVMLPLEEDLLNQGPLIHTNPEGLKLSAWILSGGC
ncbi:hypothetical protein PRIEUP_LOCUS1263 [Pristimantis euphronides]